jgi:S-adenosylmethionine-dependent methyltransferase
MTTTKVVKDYYNNAPENEWNRLEKHIFEFPVTLGFINKHIKKTNKVLDIGGGPGKYAIELSKKVDEITLFDLSEKNIELAKLKAKEIKANIKDFVVGDARDLSQFENSSFDIVLNFGPMYHLHNEKDREKTIKESLRVLKPGGIIFVAFVSKFAVLSIWFYKKQSITNKSYEERNDKITKRLWVLR